MGLSKFPAAAKPRNLWVIAAILVAIGFTIIIRKWFLRPRSENKAWHGKKECPNTSIDGAQHKYIDGEEEEKGGACAVRTYGLEELKMATKEFGARIGVGATSFVYLAELGGGKVAAVKRVMPERGGSRSMFLDEVSILLRISHPNLVGMMGFCLEKGEQLLVLEYIPKKSLFHRMHTFEGQCSGVLSWANRLNIALDVARALDYLHSYAEPPVIHRDVKSANVLLVDDDHAKLADFGLCKLGHDYQGAGTPATIKGSFGYTDTNYLKTGEVSSKSDVYSFGVLLLELISGLKSTQGSATLVEWTEDLRQSGDFRDMVEALDPKLGSDVDVSQVRILIDVANSALLENLECRPTMSQIVETLVTCCLEPLPDLPV